MPYALINMFIYCTSGQRGLNNKMGFQWVIIVQFCIRIVFYTVDGCYRLLCLPQPRECPESSYCWEAVTTDVNKVKKLFDFTWVRIACAFV